MIESSMNNLQDVDWSLVPAPIDDGMADHLRHGLVPHVLLDATDGNSIDPAELMGLCVIYVYPRTGRADMPLPDEWNIIPGARGCTPQACAFRDHFAEVRALGVNHLFGLSTQDTLYQQEAVERLHLPFPLLSDHELTFTHALKLPTFTINGMTLLKRLTLIIQSGKILQVFYPVFPPDQNVSDVISWLRAYKP